MTSNYEWKETKNMKTYEMCHGSLHCLEMYKVMWINCYIDLFNV